MMKEARYYSADDVKAPTRPSKPKMPVYDGNAEVFRAYADDLEGYENLMAEYTRLLVMFRNTVNTRKEEYVKDFAEYTEITVEQAGIVVEYVNDKFEDLSFDARMDECEAFVYASRSFNTK